MMLVCSEYVLSSMNDWKIYENGGLSAGCELKLFGRGGDSFFDGGCCVRGCLTFDSLTR